jgi:hypothetical protein
MIHRYSTVTLFCVQNVRSLCTDRVTRNVIYQSIKLEEISLLKDVWMRKFQ